MMLECKWVLHIAAIIMLIPTGGSLTCQSSLEGEARRVREAWLAHDMRSVVPGPDPVELRLPSSEPARPLVPAQAVALLQSFVEETSEVDFSFRTIRQSSEEQGYVEAVRRYVVRRTEDELRQTVFMAFRKVESQWRLTELRVLPE